MQETTGAAARPRQGFDVRRQVAQSPWLVLGAAVAAGYAFGRIGGGSGGDSGELRWSPASSTTNDFAHRFVPMPSQRPPQHEPPAGRRHDQGGRDLLAPARGEIDALKLAAVSTIKETLRGLVRDYTPEAQRARRADRGLPDPSAGQGYVETYHPTSESRGM
jgi:hypothetical protein